MDRFDEPAMIRAAISGTGIICSFGAGYSIGSVVVRRT
jgi:hypothetical protein